MRQIWLLLLALVLGAVTIFLFLRQQRREHPPVPSTPPAAMSPRVPSPRNSPASQEPVVFCPAIYDPVCGSDGKTHSNACVALHIQKVTVAHPGPCAAQ